jgi:hypothetical protein
MATSEDVLQAAVASRLGPQAGAAAEAAQEPSANTQDVAVAAAAPVTEDTAANASPISYEVKFPDGSSRSYTNDQLAGVLTRYPKLNAERADMKPVFDRAAEMMKGGMSAADVANALSPRQGADNPSAPSSGNRPEVVSPMSNEMASQFAAQLQEWENTNAVSAPPGYAQSAQRIVELETAVKMLAGKMQNMSQAAQAVSSAAQNAQAANADQAQAAIVQRISNNLNSMQANLGLDDSEASSFEQFAAQSGYTLEDFVDPNLTMMVGQNYKNARNQPEFERLQRVQQDRAAFTEQSAGTPASAGEPPQLSPAEQTLARMTEKAMQSRM